MSDFRPSGAARNPLRGEGSTAEKAYREDLKALVDRELPALRAVMLRLHLLRCAACREEAAWMSRMNADMRAIEEARPGPELRARILASLPQQQSIRIERPRSRRPALGYALGAAATVAIAAGLYTLRTGAPGVPPAHRSNPTLAAHPQPDRIAEYRAPAAPGLAGSGAQAAAPAMSAEPKTAERGNTEQKPRPPAAPAEKQRQQAAQAQRPRDRVALAQPEEQDDTWRRAEAEYNRAWSERQRDADLKQQSTALPRPDGAAPQPNPNGTPAISATRTPAQVDAGTVQDAQTVVTQIDVIVRDVAAARRNVAALANEPIGDHPIHLGTKGVLSNNVASNVGPMAFERPMQAPAAPAQTGQPSAAPAAALSGPAVTGEAGASQDAQAPKQAGQNNTAAAAAAGASGRFPGDAPVVGNLFRKRANAQNRILRSVVGQEDSSSGRIADRGIVITLRTTSDRLPALMQALGRIGTVLVSDGGNSRQLSLRLRELQVRSEGALQSGAPSPDAIGSAGAALEESDRNRAGGISPGWQGRAFWPDAKRSPFITVRIRIRLATKPAK
jgi:hypothetical protein